MHNHNSIILTVIYTYSNCKIIHKNPMLGELLPIM